LLSVANKRGFRPAEGPWVLLPGPSGNTGFALEKAIALRRSTRTFLRRPITINHLSQLLWAAQGITESGSGLRSVPSAGALYPLEVYAVVRENGVKALTAGVYRYEPGSHRMKRIRDGDHMAQLQEAALDQEAVGMSAVCIVISGVFSRTTPKYGQRGIQYVHQESGAAAENVCLEATALGLDSVVMGAFTEAVVSKTVGLGPDEIPLCLLPIGPHATG
jgi:SagB-type dehydrogenase family enzyme